MGLDFQPFSDLALLFYAYVLDLLIGDPQNFPHPVRAMGWVIEKLHPIVFRKGGSYVSGVLYPAVLIVLVLGLMYVIHLLPFPVSTVLKLYLMYTCLAAKSLASEVKKVLAVKGKAEQRKALSFLCSRDTAALSDRQVMSTLFETTSENTLDGVLAPLFYMLLAAPFGLSASTGLIYKAVSTCDSMVGYQNERFLKTGMISARLDDVLNFIPARLMQPIIWISGISVQLLSGKDSRTTNALRNAWRVYFRDKSNHSSPNSAHSMAMFAGLIGVRIGGPVPYFGEVKDKPWMGDDVHPLDQTSVLMAIWTMYISEFYLLLLGGLCVFMVG